MIAFLGALGFAACALVRMGGESRLKVLIACVGLPKLTPTRHVAPRIVNGLKRWGNQTDSGQNKLPPSADRWKIRSRTFPGIAEAMAAQWG